MKPLVVTLAICLGFVVQGQPTSGYQVPPKEILELADVELAPRFAIDSKGEYMVLLSRNQYVSLEELSETEMRLAGLRINPITNIGSRTRYTTNVRVKRTAARDAVQVEGLPQHPRLSGFRWSHDERKMAFLHTTPTGVEVWVLDLVAASAKKLTPPIVNANKGSALHWFKDDNQLLIKTLPRQKKPLIDTSVAVPTGPTISIGDGSKARNITYQDLLKTASDEFNFEQLALSELKTVDLDGTVEDFLPAAMYRGIRFSPDGSYILISKTKRPFSSLVTYGRFPHETNVYDQTGALIARVNDVPLDEVRPKGFMATRLGRRGLAWREDHPATLVYTKALDGGDPAADVPFRDAVYQLPAPFSGDGELLIKTRQRFAGIRWGNDELAVAVDYWWNTRNQKVYLFNPSDATQTPTMIQDRNYQDVYSDQGSFVTQKNRFGRNTLAMDGSTLFLMGAGYTQKGQFPFVDAFDVETRETSRLYQSTYTNKVESLRAAIDMKKGTILVRIESPTEYPNFYIRNIKGANSLEPITQFENPFKNLQNIRKQVIRYQRGDGLDLDATLYLPLNYEKGKTYPMILWAYPREYKDKSSASQGTSNPNRFVYPYWGSPIFWVARGYVVLDNAAFPIVGEDDEPNDNFISQLVANGKAAIDAVDTLGYIDRNRVAVGGHSYGAFMAANLLSHSDLFAAGIARSGAYNRTLTPFGFQSEERSFWEAPQVYSAMSPFMQADKMKTPLLLIHGAADNNPGTYPLQSERYFHALKGLGAPVRLVMLPKESHSYRARESIMHMLWERDRWLETYVKNRPVPVQAPEAKENGSSAEGP